MTTINRVDAHRPAEMVPANYTYLASSFGYKAQNEDGLMYTEIEWDGTERWEALGSPVKSTCAHAKGGQCDHCGAHHTYQTLLEYKPTGEVLSVGHTCAWERFGNPDFKNVIAGAARRAELKAARNHRVAKAVSAMSAEVLAAYEWAQTDGAQPIAADIASKVAAYGPLSVKQEAFLVKLMTEAQEVAVALEAKTITPCPTGRLTVEGEVKTTKYQESDYGGAWKMLVETTDGYKVWGTVPSAIHGVQKGDVVKFTASIQPSDNDVTFGFFSRPSKPVLVSSQPYNWETRAYRA